MWLSSRLSEFRLIELANYVETDDFKSVLRWTYKVRDDNGRLVYGMDNKPLRKPVIVDVDRINEFREKHNNLGIYRSAFYYNSTDIKETSRYAPLYFDFDDEEDTNHARSDTLAVVNYLRDNVFEGDCSAIRMFFTGSKGFHVEVEPIILGVDPKPKLHENFHFISETIRDELDAETMDMVIYESRRMWRIESSQHQKTGLFKNEISYDCLKNATMEEIEDYCKEAKPSLTTYDPENPPRLQPSASIWYREMDAKRLTEEQREREELARKRANLFMQYGTATNKPSHRFVRMVYDDALEKLKEEAEKPPEEQLRNVTLYKQAFRLFLVYMKAEKDTEELQETLEEIGEAMGLPQRESLTTIESAWSDALGKLKQKKGMT